MKPLSKSNLYIFIFLYFISSLYAFCYASRQIDVGFIVNAEPASYLINNNAGGFAVDIFKKIAQKNDLNIKFIPVKSRLEGLKKLKNFEISALIGPFIPTYLNSSKFDHSIPFYIDTLDIYNKKRPISLLDKIIQIFKPAWSLGTLYALLLYFSLALALCFVERKHHPELVKKSFLSGFTTLFWEFFVTLMRILLYQRHYTVRGRIIISIMLVTAAIFMTILAASITAGIINLKNDVHEQVVFKDQLVNSRVAVIAQRKNALLKAKSLSKNLLYYDNLAQMFKALEEGKVDAVIASKLLGNNYLKQHPKTNIENSKLSLGIQLWSYVTYKSFGSIYLSKELIKTIDKELFNMQFNDESQLICSRYFSNNLEACL